MNDKELLKFAAKAAGMYPQDFQLDDDEQIFYEKKRGISLAWGVGWWGPLTDDGAALRLAVKCGLSVQVGASVFVHGDPDFCDPAYIGVEICESLKTDPFAATRRAIVRAAAEIGKSL
jgi:hypothetical protein